MSPRVIGTSSRKGAATGGVSENIFLVTFTIKLAEQRSYTVTHFLQNIPNTILLLLYTSNRRRTYKRNVLKNVNNKKRMKMGKQNETRVRMCEKRIIKQTNLIKQ